MPPLPYDATPPPASPSKLPEEAMAVDDADETDPLNRALDDYNPVIPDHVQALMGRMSKGKVYLLEESPAVIHVDVDSRLKGDPRVAALADQLHEHDPTEWLNVVSAAAPSPIRHNALFIRSDNIKHLSTSKIFSWVTSLGTAVMGIEWLNDTTLHLIFPSAAASLLALTLLSKAGFDPAEGDDPLFERSAHAIPVSLLAKADISLGETRAGEELLGNSTGSVDADGVQRKGRGGYRTGFLSDALAPQGSAAATGWTLEEGIDPNARVSVRFAVESDQALRQKAPNSEWYARNGRRAGKEVAERKRATPYDRPDRYGNEEDEALGYTLEGGEGRDLSRRLGRGRSGRGGGRGGRREVNTADELDRELDGLRNGTSTRTRAAGKGDRRSKLGKEDLDNELDNMFSSAG